MFKIIRHNQAFQRAIRETRHQSVRKYSRFLCKQPVTNNGAMTSGIRRMASGASDGNDPMLIVAGLGVLGTTCLLGYYATNTEYQPPQPLEVTKTQEDDEQVAQPTEEEVSQPPEEDIAQPTEEELSQPPDEEIVQPLQEEVAQPPQEVVQQVEEEAPITDIPTKTEESEQPVTSIVPVTDESSTKTRKYPEEATYVIIGAGTAAHAACRAIRKNDQNAKILVIGEEKALPYMRPPLSKELWFSEDENVGETLVFKSWNGKERSVFFEKEEYYTKTEDFSGSDKGIAVITGEKVSSVNAEGHEVTLASGESIKYGKLLIATGGKPKEHAAFTDDEVKSHTTLFRNIADFQSLNDAVRNAQHVAVIGGGFLGSELACALAVQGKKRGMKVTQIYPEEGNMAKVLPKYLSDWTTKKVTKEGVEIVSKGAVENATFENNQVKLKLDNGEETLADHVVVCVGLQPNIELAQSAGLEIDTQEGGFRVNSELEARSDIWVAGDAACFYDINLGRRRVEHHDHAVVSGRLAGENMTGAKKSYKHQSMFWSDLGPDVGYEAIGICDSSLPTVGIWAKATESDTPKAAEEASGESIRSDSESENVADESTEKAVEQEAAEKTTTKVESDEESFGKGVVFYMREKKVVGILLWNIFSQMPVARKIVTEGKDHEDLNALAKLFKIH